jgi:hypothetical protein
MEQAPKARRPRGIDARALASVYPVMFEFLFGRRRPPSGPPVPTTVHLTHAKSGSTWLDRIFRDAFGERVGPRGSLGAEAAGVPLERYVFPQGLIHPAQFMSRADFLLHPELQESRRFVQIRDLRDMLVSLYFSLLKSHVPTGEVPKYRAHLANVSAEEGILYCIRHLGAKTAEIQLSWIDSGEYVLRYEDLIRDDVALVTDLFIARLGLPIEPERVEKIVLANRFEARFGRPLGSEDSASHGRQGAPGNWRKHFTRPVAEEFQAKYGHVLLATGYEKDSSWAAMPDRAGA